MARQSSHFGLIDPLLARRTIQGPSDNYFFDSRNRLSYVQNIGSDDSTEVGNTAYRYDAFDHRVSKVVTDETSGTVVMRWRKRRPRGLGDEGGIQEGTKK